MHIGCTQHGTDEEFQIFVRVKRCKWKYPVGASVSSVCRRVMCINVLLHVCAIAGHILNIQLLTHWARESSSWEWKSSWIFQRHQADRNNWTTAKSSNGGWEGYYKSRLPLKPDTRFIILPTRVLMSTLNQLTAGLRTGWRGLKAHKPKCARNGLQAAETQEEALTQLANTSEHTPFIKYRFPLSHWIFWPWNSSLTMLVQTNSTVWNERSQWLGLIYT